MSLILVGGLAQVKGLRMKRLINSTTILSMALYTVSPFAAQAQDFPKAMVDFCGYKCAVFVRR